MGRVVEAPIRELPGGTQTTLEVVKEPVLAPVTASQSDLKRFLKEVSLKYDVDYIQLEQTIQGESSFNPKAIGDDGRSLGISQYTLPTWKDFCGGIDERLDPYKSMDCMAKMFSLGKQSRWTVWRNLYGRRN